MIKSMTGFARGEIRSESGLFVTEIRTVNHKFLEITYKPPNGFAVFDDRIKTFIRSKIKRGKVYLNLTHELAREAKNNVFVDEKLAGSYYKKLKKLKKTLKAEGPVKISDIIAFPGVINHQPESKDAAKMWPLIKKSIEKAVFRLIKDRTREGAFLFKDLMKRVKKIKKITSSIKANADSNVRSYKKRLSKRVKELSSGYSIDRGRLEVEVALFAKNSDITEELTRLDNHVHNFTNVVQKNDEVGKKLDFISQELHREINTIGSKSSGFNISKGAIEAKAEIEKIREQLKNIE